MPYDPRLVLDEADNPTPAHLARAAAYLAKGKRTMAKKKPKPRKRPPATTSNITPLMRELLFKTVSRSPHLNRQDRRLALDAITKLKG